MTQAEFTSAAFYQSLRDRKLRGTRCRGCQAVYLPPRQVCPHCHRADMEGVEFSGQGRLLTFTTIAVGTTAMVAEGYSRNRHYCCGIVALDEGPRVCALILGVDAQQPDSIKIGMAVAVEFPEDAGKPAVLAFRAR